jgi:predicted P-loop ATPase
VAGIWLFEIADLAGMSKADVDRTKAFASRTADRARPAFGRVRIDRPRRCIFIATTNNPTYLKSQTGNRRFWPVRVGRIDTRALARDRDQLWAEAAKEEEAGASLTLPANLWEAAAEEQDGRRDHDPWDDTLADVIGTVVGGEERVFSSYLLGETLGISKDRQTDAHTKRLTVCMMRLGWTKPNNAIRIGSGPQGRGYVRPWRRRL